MRKLKIVFSTVCLVAVVTLALPAAAYADGDGSQGGSNSTTSKPKAPTTWAEILAWLATHTIF